jgi:hypothetical protein
MRVTDIIRGILDLAAQEAAQEQESQVAAIDVVISTEPKSEPQGADLLSIMKQLAGVSDDNPQYANEPDEQVSAMTAAFPSGDDMHHSKNPADIRTNAPSMYPGFQAGGH